MRRGQPVWWAPPVSRGSRNQVGLVWREDWQRTRKVFQCLAACFKKTVINCSLCPLGIGHKIISLICSKADVEIGDGNSFVSVWVAKHENSFLREVVVPSSQEVLRANETERHQILSRLVYYSFDQFRRWMGHLNSWCLVPTPLALLERQASPLTRCCGGNVGRQGQGTALPLQCPCSTFHAPGMIQFYNECPKKAWGSLCVSAVSH